MRHQKTHQLIATSSEVLSTLWSIGCTKDMVLGGKIRHLMAPSTVCYTSVGGWAGALSSNRSAFSGNCLSCQQFLTDGMNSWKNHSSNNFISIQALVCLVYLTGSTLRDTFFRARGFLALPTIVSRSLCSPVALAQAEIVTLSLLTLYLGALLLSLREASVLVGRAFCLLLQWFWTSYPWRAALNLL